MKSSSELTSPTANPTPSSNEAERNLDNANSIESTLSRSTSHDPTAYVQRARVTRAAPPKPASNPLQFIQIKPCNLYQSAQEQLKRAEEIKKVKETKKEEPEDWQSNLDNWKSCRRKRVEHIIDRVVEVKKLELEEHDRARKKSKTFSEMMEERNTKGRKVSLAVYVDDEANDLSDLGIGTSTASGKSSLSEDFDNNSVLSDNQDNEKSNFDIDNQGNDNDAREYVSSPGYDTSSTHPPSSPDLCEYTYEGAIQDYKSRVSRAQKCSFYSENNQKDSNSADVLVPRKQTSMQIENRLSNFEGKVCSESERSENMIKKDLPKVDIARRRELFERDKVSAEKQETEKMINNLVNDFSQTVSIKERLLHLESRNDSHDLTNTKMDCLSTEFGSVKERLLDIEKTSTNPNVQVEKPVPIDVPIVSIKHRLSALQDAVPTNVDDQLAAMNTLEDSTEVSDVSSSDRSTEIQENKNINNNQESLSLEDSERRIENSVVECAVVTQAMETEDNETLEVVDEEPNRLLSTINEAIHLAEDQSEDQSEEQADDIAKRDSSVLEALELAFKAIDTESQHEASSRKSELPAEPIYENVTEVDILYRNDEINANIMQVNEEPYYQIPKSIEPHYQVPKSKPESLYENVAIVLSANGMKSALENSAKDDYSINVRQKLEPPKEKPPPPPMDDDGEVGDCEDDEAHDQPMKRTNSTRRIKKEIRIKRSSFLGIDGSTEDEIDLLMALQPPLPSIHYEDKRARKQNYIKAGLYSNSDTSESRDSGVSDNHSRQSSEEYEEVVPSKEHNTNEQIANWSTSQSQHKSHNYSMNGSSGNEFLNQKNVGEDIQVKYLEGQIREQEEVLRLEKELLQLEQEELKRQRENLLFRKNLTKRELQKNEEKAFLNNIQSMDNIHSTSNYYCDYPVQSVDYRQSMPNLNVDVVLPIDQNPNMKPTLAAVPPAKPLRANQLPYAGNNREMTMPPTYVSHNRNHLVPLKMSDEMRNVQSVDEVVQLRNNSTTQNGNMSRHTLHALSAVPRPKFRDGWVHSKNLQNRRKTTSDYVNMEDPTHRYNNNNFNYNSHWLIQEAEQRRIDQQRGVRPTTSVWQHSNILRKGSNDDKPLPDAVIKTLTQRVQSRGLGERKRNSLPVNISQQRHFAESHDEPLSISGKKKCSYCNEELGRGAAMIIESLLLFYHLNCFKCFVCRIQLGDGVSGADVRVRNFKLHCQNCFSSDDGIKFSCV